MLKLINKIENQHHLYLISVLIFDFKFKSLKLSNNVAHDFNVIKMQDVLQQLMFDDTYILMKKT